MPGALQWLAYTSYIKYGYEALCKNEFEVYEWGAETLKEMVRVHLHCVLFVGFLFVVVFSVVLCGVVWLCTVFMCIDVVCGG